MYDIVRCNEYDLGPSGSIEHWKPPDKNNMKINQRNYSIQYHLSDFDVCADQQYSEKIIHIDVEEICVFRMGKQRKFWRWPNVVNTIWYKRDKSFRKLPPLVQIEDRSTFFYRYETLLIGLLLYFSKSIRNMLWCSVPK